MSQTRQYEKQTETEATVGETRRIDKKQREEARLSRGPEKSNRGVGRYGDRRRL